MKRLVDDLKQTVAKIKEGGGASAKDKHVAKNKLLPRERINRLLDPG